MDAILVHEPDKVGLNKRPYTRAISKNDPAYDKAQSWFVLNTTIGWTAWYERHFIIVDEEKWQWLIGLVACGLAERVR